MIRGTPRRLRRNRYQQAVGARRVSKKAKPKKRARNGRPTTLTKAIARRIIGHVARGNYPAVAARACSVPASTYKRWMTRGRREKSGIYRDFRTAIQDAKARGQVVVVEGLHRTARREYKAAVEYLKRTAPELWGDRVQQHVTTQPARRQPDLSRLTTEELEQWAALADKAIPPTQGGED